MTMTFDDGVAWLRSGHYSENLMIQITSKALTDEAAASCGVSQWPLICANSDILSISNRDFTGSDGVKFYGVITRVTGVGERFTKELTGQPISGSGSLHIVFDDTPMMLEVADQDWTSSVIEIRTGEYGTEWADALELFTGSIESASTLNVSNGVSFRLVGNDHLLDEMVDYHAFDEWNNEPVWRGAATFGYVSKFPAVTEDSTTAGTLWNFTACNWDCESVADGISPFPTVWLEDKKITNEVISNHAEGYSYCPLVTDAGVATSSGSPRYYPAQKVWVSLKGYNEGTGGFIDKTGEILQEAVSIGITRPDGSGQFDTINPALDDVTLDTTYFDDYDTDYAYETGMVTDMINVTHGSLWKLNGDDASWRDVFNRLVGDTGGLWYFTRDNKLRIQSLIDAPSGTEVIEIRRSDYESVDYRVVEAVDGALLQHSNHYPDPPVAPSVYGDGQGKGFIIKMETSLSNATDQAAFGARLLARHGERDATFKNCLLAKVLNIGDIVTVTDPDDDFLSAGKKGWVIGVDRGTNPYVEFRL